MMATFVNGRPTPGVNVDDLNIYMIVARAATAEVAS